MERYIIADTNIWLLNPNWYEEYKDSIIVVPRVVIEELDKKKNSPGMLGLNARMSCKIIGRVAEKYETFDEIKYIVLDDKYKFSIEANYFDTPKKLLDVDLSNDNKIIATAIYVKHKTKADDVILLSNDCNVRAKTALLYSDCGGVKAREYKQENSRVSDYYSVERFSIDDDNIISKLYNGTLRAEELSGITNTSIHTPIYLDYNNEVILGVIGKDGIVEPLQTNKKSNPYQLVGDIKPLNEGQIQFINMMKNSEIKVIGCIGRSGSGKSLLALASALKLFEDGQFSHIKLIKPYVSLGNTVGYLKGTLEDKIEPIKASFITVFELLGYSLEELEHQGSVDFSVPEFERGQTYHNTIVIIDECQNLTNVEIKSLITRCSESSKVILLGDTKQIDSLYLSESYNGLSYVIDKLSGQDFFGGIYLWKSERANFINIVDDLL